MILMASRSWGKWIMTARHTIDSEPTMAGGREFVRTVACAHCGSDDVTGYVTGASERAAWVRYRCTGCSGWTVLHAHTQDGGNVYVRRMGAPPSERP